MNETLKRTIYGSFYVVVMWLGTSFSELTFRLLFTLLGIVSIYEMWKLRRGKTKTLAFLYVIIPFCIIQLIELDYTNIMFNRKLILFILILTWTFDTFAYIVGVRFGKNKIMPSISPKKSWEGFIGGFIFTIIASYLSYRYFGFHSFKNALTISIIIPFTATIGDFIESYYKREADVKDSGYFIPGHGGMLDRMDAFLITIPILYLLTNIL